MLAGMLPARAAPQDLVDQIGSFGSVMSLLFVDPAYNLPGRSVGCHLDTSTFTCLEGIAFLKSLLK